MARRGARRGRHSHGRVLVLPGGQVVAYHGLVQEHGAATGCGVARRREEDGESRGTSRRRHNRSQVRRSLAGRHTRDQGDGLQGGQLVVDGRVRAAAAFARIHQR